MMKVTSIPQDLPFEKLSNIFVALNEDSIVAITDKSGRIIYVNKKFCEISKYSLPELIGQNHRILKSGYHPPEFYRNLWDTISQGKTWKGNIKNKAKDGSYYWVKTTILPILDKFGKSEQFVSIRTDITKEIKKQERLNKSLNLLSKAKTLSSIYENSVDLFRSVDLNGIIIDCNQTYADSLGYTKDEILGNSMFEHTSEKSLSTIKRTFHQWKKSGKVINNEIFLRRKDGTSFPVLLSANNLHDSENNIIGSNTILRDISELYRLRKEQEKNTKKMREQYQELKKLTKQKDEFLAMITHELKTPLVPIIAYIDLILENKFGDLTKKQQKSLSIVKSNSQSLLELISDLLDAHKIELGIFDIKKDHHYLADIISEVIEHSELSSSTNSTASTDNTSSSFTPAKDTESTNLKQNFKNISTQYRLDKTLSSYCDPKRIQQVINNLIANAIDFCPETNGKISISLTRINNNAKILIKDNGAGIQKSKLDKIFKKFYQVDTSLIRSHGGTGLGLSICKEIIEAHNGAIFAKSEGTEKGTEIHIILPLSNFADTGGVR